MEKFQTTLVAVNATTFRGKSIALTLSYIFPLLNHQISCQHQHQPVAASAPATMQIQHRVSTQNHSKVDNWLQLHKCASNINRCTHKNKRILAIPVPETKAKVRDRIVQDLHDEKVSGKGLRKRNVNHRDAKSADKENQLSLELEAEVNVSHAILKHFIDYEKSYPACPARNITKITINGTKGQVLDSTTKVGECKSFSGHADLNDLKLIMPDVAYQERYNISAIQVNSLNIGLIESPSSSKKKPAYEEMLEMEER
ncbi:uncharacterized protein LOC132603344 isoform X2 [Lycium barbarum]|uniref:uncharacterized protein LOC132603344 isoform X2 n=1 Tax=Lycium barbarum TaxID=112863 RepID=UPI00293ED9B4|nr:uncharacterized protein LOC132603344 isoform X2 [Lycium barbarum]